MIGRFQVYLPIQRMGALCDLVRYNNLARTNGEYQKMVTSTMLVDVVSKTSKQLFGYGCVQRE